MVSTIILAAGASRRMGEPKPLALFNQETFLESVMRKHLQAGICQVVTVLGCSADLVIERLGLKSKSYVVNDDYARGQFSSFKTGLERVAMQSSGVFLALVDQPQIHAPILTQLLDAFEQDPEKIVIPTHGGRRGHPPIFPKVLFNEILETGDDRNASDIIRAHQSEVMEIEIDDDRILWNLNTKEDLVNCQKWVARSQLD